MRGPRRFLLRAAVAAVLTIAAACAPAEPVAVGAALSATFVNATRLAIEDAVSAGGLPPLDTLLLSESTNRAAPAIELAEQLIGLPGIVAVIGHSNSSASLAASQTYNGAQVVQIAPTSTAARYAEAGIFSFRMVPSDHRQGELLAQAVGELKPGGARVALLFVNDDYGRGMRSAVLQSLDVARHTVVLDAPHIDVEADEVSTARERQIEDEVSSVAARRPDVILWLGRAGTLSRYLGEFRRRLGEIPILGGDALAPGHNLAATDPAWIGVRYADFFDPEATVELRAFRARFTERFGVQLRTSEVLSYDAMRLVLAAVASGARTGPQVREWLLRLGREEPAFSGLSGPISFTAEGGVMRPYVLITIPGPP